MRTLFVFALFCLACVAGNDLIDGQRQEGDALIVDIPIVRAGIPGDRVTIVRNVNVNGLITKLVVTNVDGSDSNITLMKGGTTQRFAVIFARAANMGEGINIRVQAYAVPFWPPAPPAIN